MRYKITIILVVLVAFASAALAQNFGRKKRTPRPEEWGTVIISKYSEKNNLAPVVFKHWLHRAKYTCRVCHVDVGFGMEANSTDMKEADFKSRLYCGACHNGKEAFGHEKQNCERCHSLGKDVKMKYEFYEFVKNFPPARFGNRVDWLKAEEKGLIKPKDQLEGLSIKRAPIPRPKDFEIKTANPGMPDIIFSHKIHADINGCELCHPDVFGAKRGSTKYSMQDIFAGRFCGSCHSKVAFPNADCQLCHLKEVS